MGIILALFLIFFILYRAGGGLIDYTFEASGDNFDGEEITWNRKEIKTIPQEDKPINVKIKNNSVDVNRIIEYKGKEIKKFEFRPQTWEQFIGQEFAKEQAQTIMKKAKRGIRSHFLLSAIKGHGKTTWVELFAKTLGAKLISRIGKQIDEDSLVDIINEINTSKEKFVILFIDEFDTMDWKVIKILNPIIEQYKINGKKIKPFIFASATINKHLLIKNNPDTLDRIPHHIQFVRYSSEEIAKIIRQYKQQLYPNENISEETLLKLSKNAKFNPRTAISLLEDYIVEQNLKRVLQNRHIIKNGLTNLDIKILKVLNEQKRPIGANALSQKVGIGQSHYLREYEPFLAEFNYLERVPSRIITNKGKKLLKEIGG